MCIRDRAGGCFWGVEEYFSRVPGVIDAESGYANGKGDTTKYELVPQTGHAETVHITYNVKQVSLKELLLHYFRIIDPTSKNRQGNDQGLSLIHILLSHLSKDQFNIVLAVVVMGKDLRIS